MIFPDQWNQVLENYFVFALFILLYKRIPSLFEKKIVLLNTNATESCDYFLISCMTTTEISVSIWFDVWLMYGSIHSHLTINQ